MKGLLLSLMMASKMNSMFLA